MIDPIVLGSGGKLVLEGVTQMRANGASTSTHLPKWVMQGIVRQGVKDDVGGSMAIGIANALECRLYRLASPIASGQPGLKMTYNGIDIDAEVGLVGQYMVGLHGMV